MPPANKSKPVLGRNRKPVSEADAKKAAAANKQTIANLRTAISKQTPTKKPSAAPKPKYNEDKHDVAYRFEVSDKSGKSLIDYTSRMTPLEAAQEQQDHESKGHNVKLTLVPVNKKTWTSPTKPSPKKDTPTPNGVGLSTGTARGAKSAPKGTPRRSRARGDAHYLEAAKATPKATPKRSASTRRTPLTKSSAKVVPFTPPKSKGK